MNQISDGPTTKFTFIIFLIQDQRVKFSNSKIVLLTQNQCIHFMNSMVDINYWTPGTESLPRDNNLSKA